MVETGDDGDGRDGNSGFGRPVGVQRGQVPSTGE